MSGTISQPGFLIQSGDFVFDQAFDVRLWNWTVQSLKWIHWLCQAWPDHPLFRFPVSIFLLLVESKEIACIEERLSDHMMMCVLV